MGRLTRWSRRPSRAPTAQRNHRLGVELEDGLPVVRVDPHAVAEVVYTLVDNAAKYSPPGTNVRVSAARAEDEMIRLAVEDEGRGIPPDLRERVFDKFFRATRDGDAGGGHSPAGTGMGLAIARGIVEAHGGDLAEGRGGRGGARVFTSPRRRRCGGRLAARDGTEQTAASAGEADGRLCTSPRTLWLTTSRRSLASCARD